MKNKLKTQNKIYQLIIIKIQNQNKIQNIKVKYLSRQENYSMALYQQF